MNFLVFLLLLRTLPVVTLDYEGGCTPPRESAEPYLAVYLDGRVVARNPYLPDAPRAMQLSRAAAKRLVRDVAPSIATPELPRDYTPRVEDAATVRIRVGRRVGEQHALDLVARDFPGRADVQALQAAHDRLDALWKTAMAGGEARAAKFVARANEVLAEEWPDAAPFGVSDLSIARDRIALRRSEGRRWIAVVFTDDRLHVERGG